MKTQDLIKFGIINIDKPAGPTSHQVAEYVRKILNLKKTGHSGTLDPNVTGCLPVALGKATRILELMLKHGKEYVCVMELHKDVDEKQLRKTIRSFIGEIEQLPPVKSAVKRKLRKRNIYELEILDIKKRKILFKVSCQAGTYIRVLCHQIGLKLGIGAHMLELRRTRAGVFDESSLVTLNDLRDAYELWKQGNKLGENLLRKYIQPIEAVIKNLPKVYVNETGKKRILHGQNLRGIHITRFTNGNKNENVAVMEKTKLIALGRYTKDSDKIKDDKERLALNVFKVFNPFR